MEKIDFKKKFKHLYQPSAKEVVQVEVPPLSYLMVDGDEWIRRRMRNCYWKQWRWALT